MKRVAKGIFLFIGTTLYVWLLFLSVGAMEARLTLSEPTTIKKWLSEAGVYGAVVDEVGKLATIQQSQESSPVQITSEDIVEAAKDSFTASSVQTDGEKVIDGFYGWLKGTTSGPEFNVDLSGRQAAFAKAITDKLEVKIQALPECTSTGKFSVQAFDPFRADCRPKGADVTAQLTKFENELATSKNILPQTSFSASDIKVTNKDGQQDGIETVLSWVPRAYKTLMYGPFLVIVITLACALSLIFLSTSRRKGLRRFANGLVFVGVIMLASGFLLGPAFIKLNAMTSKSLGAQASITQNIIDPLFAQMNKTYSRYNIIIGIALLIPAVITYSMLLLTRVKKHEDVTHEEYIEESIAEQPANEPVTQNTDQPTHEQAPQQVQAMPVETPVPESTVQTTQVPATQPIARPIQRPVTRRPPMIQG